MRISRVGGGPAGLYFAILMKKADPRHEVIVFERNRPDDTFGFGVVFSDATLGTSPTPIAESHDAIRARFAHWDDIDIHYRGERHRARRPRLLRPRRAATLLDILEERARELGVELRFETEVDDAERRAARATSDLVVAADGVNSAMRARFADRVRARARRRARTASSGSARRSRSTPSRSTSRRRRTASSGCTRIATTPEPARPSSSSAARRRCARAGLDRGRRGRDHRVLRAALRRRARAATGCSRTARSGAASRRCAASAGTAATSCSLGDAAHTAHFSIGSGTKLAMEDAIALADGARSRSRDVPERARRLRGGAHARGRARCSAPRRPASSGSRTPSATSAARPAAVRVQPADAQPAHHAREPEAARSRRSSRDVDALVRAQGGRAGAARLIDGDAAPPPMFTPFRLRELVLANRVVVSPMCQYSAEDGMPNDWHLVHLGSRALGGAGLVMAEMTDVSAEGRITPGCAGHVPPEHVDGVAAHRRLRARALARRRSACSSAHAGRKGVDAGCCGRAWTSRCRRRQLAAARRRPPIPYFPRATRCRARWTARTWTR